MMANIMKRRAALHLHAAGHRLFLAEARWAMAPDPLPGQSILHGMPGDLRDLAGEEMEQWLLDDRIDPETGREMPGTVFTLEERASLETCRANVRQAREFKRAAVMAARIPFFSFFLPPPTGGGVDERDTVGVLKDARPPIPPPPITPGGRSLPTNCLTPRLLAQRPQFFACATWASCAGAG